MGDSATSNESPSRRQLCPRLGAAGTRFSLHLPHDAQHVAAHYLPYVLIGESALLEGSNQIRRLADVFKALGQFQPDAIEVRSQADVVDSGDGGGVLNVIDQAAERRLADGSDLLQFDFPKRI